MRLRAQRGVPTCEGKTSPCFFQSPRAASFPPVGAYGDSLEFPWRFRRAVSGGPYRSWGTNSRPLLYDAALALNACVPDGEKVERGVLLAAARELGHPKLTTLLIFAPSVA